MMKILSVFCSIALLLTSSLYADEERLPNIILCMADDQGWGDVAYNGHPHIKTPVLDEMSRSGLRLDRFYSAAPVCSPTRASVLTGRHPNRARCFTWGHVLPSQEWTIADALKEKGYATGHFGKWHLGSVSKQSPFSPGHHGFEEWFSAPNFFELNPWLSHQGQPVKTEGEGSEVIVAKALDFIKTSNEKKKPFFAVIWFGSPHLPHIAMEKDKQPYQNLSKKEQNYLGEITAMDRSMGQLRDGLESLGLRNNTLLWYTSDNGARPPGSTGGLRGKKGELWEGGIRVPAIIEWPEVIREHRQSDLPGNTVDILPTLLELTGISSSGIPHPIDGESLGALIVNGNKADRQPMGFWNYPAQGNPQKSDLILEQLHKDIQNNKVDRSFEELEYDLTRNYSKEDLPGHAAIIDGPFKLHRIPKKDGQIEFQLYDLTKDPQEKTDLSGKKPKITRKIKKKLNNWQISVINSMNGNDYQK